jgi:hypothetical protein
MNRKRRTWKSLRAPPESDDETENAKLLLVHPTPEWEHVEHCDAPVAVSYYRQVTEWLYGLFR